VPTELAALDAKCSGGDGQSCYDLAAAYYEGKGVPKDPAASFAAAGRACKAGHAGGCYNHGAALYMGDGAAKDQAASIPFFEKACAAKHAGGCFNLGVIYLKGEGATADENKAREHMRKACLLGHEKACEVDKELGSNSAAASSSSQPQGVANANVNVDSITADGLTVKQMSCRLDGGGGGLLGALVGPTVVIAALAKKKAQLDGCAKGGAEPRVTWEFKNGKTTKVSAVAAQKAVATCVENALKTAPASGTGECALTLVLGKK
jgi:TPR repeat protein